MYQIDHPTAAASLPSRSALGTVGYFTEGDAVLGVPRTVLTQEFMNTLMLELMNAVTGAGLALDKTNNSQLLAAMKNLGHSTGDGKLTLKATADVGWVMADDGTIGSAASGASTRANADTQALYTLLWNNVSNTYAPVTGGRGANAAADFAANKKIALTKQLGRAIAIAGTGSGLSNRDLGQTVGEETHSLTANENGQHAHAMFNSGTVSTNTPIAANQPAAAIRNAGSVSGDYTIQQSSGGAAADVGVTGDSGTGSPHNNMQPTSFWNVMIKL